jgi:hypothetical protein
MDERSLLNPADSATNIDGDKYQLAADLRLSCDDDDQSKITLNCSFREYATLTPIQMIFICVCNSHYHTNDFYIRSKLTFRSVFFKRYRAISGTATDQANFGLSFRI